MKNKIFTAIFILLLSNIYAQTIKVVWGTEYKNEKKETIGNVLYDDGINVFATLTTSEGGIFSKVRVTPTIVKFDHDMVPVKRRDYASDEKDLLYHGTYYIQGKFFMVTSRFEKRTNSRELYAQKFDKDLEPDGRPQLLWKVVGVKGEDVSLIFRFSEDSTKFMIAAIADQKKKENKNFALNVFNGDLKSVFEKAYEFQIPEEGMQIMNVEVNDKSDVFILYKAYKEGKYGKDEMKVDGKKIAAYDIRIKKFSPDNSEKESTIDLGGRFLLRTYEKDDRQGNLLVLASYENDFEKGINGYVYMKIDAKTGNITPGSDWEIPMELYIRLNLIQDDKPKSKQPAINRYFSVSDFNVNADGSVNVILEKNYSITYSGKVNYTAYYSEGMIELAIDNSGKVSWYKYIPKLQLMNDLRTYIYHAAMFANGKTYILFNDEMKNENYDYENSKKSPKRFDERKKMNLRLVEIDKNGNLTTSIFGNSETMETTIDMLLTKQISSTRMVLCGYKYKNSEVKLGTANFE